MNPNTQTLKKKCKKENFLPKQKNVCNFGIL